MTTTQFGQNDEPPTTVFINTSSTIVKRSQNLVPGFHTRATCSPGIVQYPKGDLTKDSTLLEVRHYKDWEDYKLYCASNSQTTLTFFALARMLQSYLSSLFTHQEHHHALVAVCFAISAAHRSIFSCTYPVARAFIYTSLLILHALSITMARWITSKTVCKEISKTCVQ